MNFLRGIGPLEIFLIFVIIMVVFGVGKLPEVGEGLGRGIRLFKNSLAQLWIKYYQTKLSISIPFPIQDLLHAFYLQHPFEHCSINL